MAWLQAMLDAESALASACADSDLIPKTAAKAIATKCKAGLYDVVQIGRDAAQSATAVIPLVKALREKTGEKNAKYVHFGATSQDIIDTAMMLVAKRSMAFLSIDLLELRSGLATLAAEHRETPIIGRTLLQQALPTTFGLKAAGWFSSVSETAFEIVTANDSGLLAAQLGGAVGTLHEYGDKSIDVVDAYAEKLELASPWLSWHTQRMRPAHLATALGLVSGALSKIALDVALLAQSEIGELHEASGPGRGGSTAMPHKRNPVGSVAITAIGKRVPGLVSTMLTAMAQEQERAAGAWQAEWETLSELLRLVGSQAVWARELVAGLEIDVDRMASNLEAAVIAVGGDPEDINVGSAPFLVERLLAESMEEED